MIGIFNYAKWILRGLIFLINLNTNVKKDFQNPS